MDVRSYWISKLPTVRKQSPATGKLVEHLLINDSSVAKSALVEMAKLYNRQSNRQPNKLQEADTVEKRVETLKKALEFISERMSTLLSGNGDINTENYNKVSKAKEAIERKLKELAPDAEKEATGEELGFFKKILNKIAELYHSIGLKSIWNKVKGLVNSKTKIAIATSIIILALIAGVYIQKKYGSVGKSILTVIISVTSLGLFATAVFNLRKFFSDVYNLIVHLIETIRNKFRKKPSEAKPETA